MSTGDGASQTGEDADREGLTLLVDASSLVYRAYFAVPATVKAPDGTPVNGALGFLNMLARLVADLRPSFVACATDHDWRPQWRVDLVDSYKAHRVVGEEDEAEESLERQFEVLEDVLARIGFAVVGAPGFEAEDVIGTLAARARGPVAIVSGDRDLFQLVRDPDVVVLYPVRGVSELVRVDEAEIRRRYGIPGRAYADFAVLRGDPSDGLPGVRGIGEKTAASLIHRYESLDAVVDAAREQPLHGPLAKVAKSLEYVERARRVVRIEPNAPVDDVSLRVPEVVRAKRDELMSAAETFGLSGAVGRLLEAVAALQ